MEPEHLDGQDALKFAGKLTAVPEFPPQPEAVPAIADALAQMIVAQEIGGEWWSPVRQVGWLIEQIFWTWSVWRGPAAMRKLYTSRFDLPVELRARSAESAWTPPEPVPVLCGSCRDSGVVKPGDQYQWCGCRQAELFRAEVPAWLDLLNRPAAPHSARAVTTPVGRTALPPLAPDVQRRIREGIAACEAERTNRKDVQVKKQNVRRPQTAPGYIGRLRHYNLVMRVSEFLERRGFKTKFLTRRPRTPEATH